MNETSECYSDSHKQKQQQQLNIYVLKRALDHAKVKGVCVYIHT